MKPRPHQHAQASCTQTRISVAVFGLIMFTLAAIVIATCRAAVPVLAATGDAARGNTLFEKRCGGCHSLDADKEGPRLRNVYGRRAGSISTFNYSVAMKNANITWNENTLDKWLAKTESVVPDNDMEFHVPKAEERADIIAYLRISSGK